MEQVKPGPQHSAKITETAINGVVAMHAPSVDYAYGTLSEIVTAEWPTIFRDPIEHMYLITNTKNQRDVWHVHKKTEDRYVLISGDIEVALFDAREESATKGEHARVTLSPLGSDGSHALAIPAGVWHTFRCLGESLTLLNSKSPAYNRADPDKFEVPFENEFTKFSWDD